MGQWILNDGVLIYSFESSSYNYQLESIGLPRRETELMTSFVCLNYSLWMDLRSHWQQMDGFSTSLRQFLSTWDYHR